MKRTPRKPSLPWLMVFSRRFSYGVMVAIVCGYMGWTMVRAIHKSYQMNQTITGLKRTVEERTIANENLKNLIVYYQTATYQELEARRRLNVKKPGEKVFIIPEHQQLATQGTSVSGNRLSEHRNSPSAPNYVKWFQYIWYGGL